MRQDEILQLEIKNENKEDIKNSYDFNQIDPYSPSSKEGLQYPPSIFDGHNSWL